MRRSADLKELKEIEKYEQDIFKEIIKMKINEVYKDRSFLETQIANLKSTKKLFGEGRTKKEQDEIRKLEEKLNGINSTLNKYDSLLKTIGNKTQKDYFLWELDFIEVFSQKGGFDIVIGNPPYVRQELIAPPLENKNNYTDERWREIKREYKEKLIQSVKNTLDVSIKIDRKSDLYVYFYYQGFSLLRPGGIFTFINSNSWLDVGYGAGLQEFLLKNMKPLFIFDNLKKRSFKQADVNTIIVVIQKPEQKLDDYTIKFVAFKKPFEEINNAEVIKKIYNASQPIFDDEDFRIYPKTKKELLIEGIEVPEEESGLLKLESEQLPYIGNKWGGKYLRAPEIYFKILEKGKGKLVRLGDIAEVKAGIITGNNAKYYRPRLKEFNKNEYSLVFKSPREVNKILLTENDAVSIIKVKNVPFEIRKAPLLWVDLRGDKHICHFNKDNLPFEHNFYGIFGKNIENKTVCLFLNSTLVWFFIEVLGRKGLGGGAIRMVRIDLLQLPCLKSLHLDFDKFQGFVNREIKSVFTELGFDPNKPIREQEPNPLADRKALDDIVFDALGLTEEERKEVYWSVAELVKNRLEKARSV
ncbi:MAG TPA: hypothetical protein ENO30_04240 [Thermodesulfobium narugense]|nr:hypothetical protein [Thermodesulfobium narugense]